MDWQPIETAPKDGKPVLVCWGQRNYDWRATTVQWWRPAKDDDSGAYWALWVPGSYVDDDDTNPTHWSPEATAIIRAALAEPSV